ncbi:MAG: hypothetical protein QF633_02055, partial [Candidatus Poseidoniaceae archaeon]|nr:hypothetical protein [Candidatus Poseidoniaceae archaeon]
LQEEDEQSMDIVQAGPPASNGPPIQQSTMTPHHEPEQQATSNEQGPMLPAEGLPQGWTMEQWSHYGQQYLDRMKGQA